MKYLLKGKASCFAFVLLSGPALAQAPVADLTTQAQTSVQPNAPVGVSSLEDRVAILERIVQSRTAMQQRMQQQIDTMQGEVDELRGAVELHTNQLEKVLQRQRELYLEIDKRVESIKQQTAVQAPNATPGGQSTQALSSVATTLSETDAYDAAVNLILKTREYDKAIPAFESFLQAYPDSEYADNAHYWLGQLLFNQQQWNGARESFTTVVERFTNSTKRADAMLKLGVIAERNNNAGVAKQWFERVINEYPDSSAAKLAQSRF